MGEAVERRGKVGRAWMGRSMSRRPVANPVGLRQHHSPSRRRRAGPAPTSRSTLPWSVDRRRTTIDDIDEVRVNSAAENLPWEVDVFAVKQLLDEQADFLLLDCREQSEFQTANIGGAVLVPMSEIQQRLGELDAQRQRRVVVHCHHGGRSLRVARWLREQGFSRAQSMAGGIDAWSLQIDSQVPRY